MTSTTSCSTCRQREDTTILLTTHDLAEAEKLADRILILAGGRIVADGSPEELAREVATEARVRWSRDGEHFVEATTDATEFVRQLFAQHGEEIRDLDVRRASLEDTYLTIVRQHEDEARNAARRSRGGRVMNARAHAVRVGAGRGWTEFSQSVRSTQDQGFYLFTAVAVLGYLFFRRDSEVEGIDLLYPSVAMPSILGGLVTFGAGDRAGVRAGDGARGRHPAAGQGGAQRRDRLRHRSGSLPEPEPGAVAGRHPHPRPSCSSTA